eukprot:PLAT14295.1.p1 GENE.PLAT14295.1~~PLAT14295.1.p1  ORF type:complete len:341 (-),score=141.23 PLAT14295.1:23-1045(-)
MKSAARYASSCCLLFAIMASVIAPAVYAPYVRQSGLQLLPCTLARSQLTTAACDCGADCHPVVPCPQLFVNYTLPSTGVHMAGKLLFQSAQALQEDLQCTFYRCTPSDLSEVVESLMRQPQGSLLECWVDPAEPGVAIRLRAVTQLSFVVCTIALVVVGALASLACVSECRERAAAEAAWERLMPQLREGVEDDDGGVHVVEGADGSLELAVLADEDSKHEDDAASDSKDGDEDGYASSSDGEREGEEGSDDDGGRPRHDSRSRIPPAWRAQLAGIQEASDEQELLDALTAAKEAVLMSDEPTASCPQLPLRKLLIALRDCDIAQSEDVLAAVVSLLSAY